MFNVEHWKDSENGVGRADLEKAEDGIHFSEQITVCQHDTFGICSGAGRVKQGG